MNIKMDKTHRDLYYKYIHQFCSQLIDSNFYNIDDLYHKAYENLEGKSVDTDNKISNIDFTSCGIKNTESSIGSSEYILGTISVYKNDNCVIIELYPSTEDPNLNHFGGNKKTQNILLYLK